MKKHSTSKNGTTDNKIRICFIIDNLSRAGTETQLLLLLRNLDRSKVTPYLCLLNGQSEESRALEPDNIPILRFNVIKILSFKAVKAASYFFSFLKKNKIHILQTYFPDSTQFAAPIGKLAGCKVLGARRNIGHWMKPIDYRVMRCVNAFFVNMIVANCDAARQSVIDQEKISSEKVVVIPNGIDLISFENHEQWNRDFSKENWIIGMVGNLRQVKGVDVYIHAAKSIHDKYPHVKFLVAGGGSKLKYQKTIDDLGMTDAIFLKGNVANVPEFLKEIDVAVLPSRAEGLSGALLEYMAAGRPIVATAVGGNTELIQHKKNGLLVEPENVSALASGIERYFKDYSLASSCATMARKDAFRKYSSSKLVYNYMGLLQTIAQ